MHFEATAWLRGTDRNWIRLSEPAAREAEGRARERLPREDRSEGHLSEAMRSLRLIQAKGFDFGFGGIICKANDDKISISTLLSHHSCPVLAMEHGLTY